jgi:RNA polymerase sigma factor (sigma-70 family)
MVGPDVPALVRQIRRLAAPAREQAPDRYLLSHYLERHDEQAFAEIVRRHGAMVLGVCRGVLGDAHDAEDACQATFLVLARRASAIRRQDSLAGFLHGVALRLAQRARAASARGRALARRAARPPQAAADDLSWRDLRAVLHEELARLPAQYRAPLVLCYLEGLTRDEAAGRLGWPATTLKGRLARGRDLLRRRLVRRGLAPAAPLLAGLLCEGLASAALPAPVVAEMARAALAFAPGQMESAAAVLANGLLRTTAASKAKLVLAALTVVFLALGAGAIFTSAAFSPAPAAADPPAAAPARPPEAKERRDVHGDPLPPGAVARLGTVRFRTGPTPWWLGASPDGKLLVTTGSDGSVRLWEVSSGRAAGRLEGHRGGVRCAVFSPDARRLATAGARSVRAWDVASAREVWQTDVGAGGLLAFSADGKTLAVAEPGQGLRVLDAATGRVLHDPGPKNGIPRRANAAFSADGKYAVTASPQAGAAAPRAAFDLWDVATGKVLRRLGEADVPVVNGIAPSSLALSPDGKTCAAITDKFAGSVTLLGDLTGVESRRLRTTHGGYTTVTFSPDRKALALGDSYGYLHLVDLATGKPRFPSLSVRMHPCEVRGLVFLPGGEELASVGDDGVLRLWDPRTGAEVKPRAAPQSRLRALAVSPDGKSVFTAGAEQMIRQWDAATGREVRRLEGDINGNGGLAMSPDGRTLVSVGDDYFIRLWDTATGRERRHWRGGYSCRKGAVAFAPGGKPLATGWEDNSVALWDLGGNEVRRLKGHQLWPEKIAFSADGKVVASCSYDRTIRLWDVATGKEVQTIGDPDTSFMALSLSPDGKMVAVATYGEGRVRVYDVAGGKELRRLGAPGGNAGYAVAFSPDGRTLAVGDEENTVSLWETATWQKRRVFRGHTSLITALAFLPGGRLVSASADTTALVWDVRGER